MKKRSIVALVVVGVMAGVLWAALERFQNRLTVENRSGQPLTLRVTTGGETITLPEVPAGGEVTAAFPIRSDDHFAVGGMLAHGTAVGGEFGYVTNGMSGQRARFDISPGGKVEFSQSDWICPY
jgi:hypothetical protein